MSRRIKVCRIFILAAIAMAAPVSSSAAAAAPVNFKPNRVLIIIGDQWTDPNGQIIDGPHGEGPVVSYVKEVRIGTRSGIPFWHLAALLKIWGIPFDILRLDQANLYINYFLNHRNEPAYGAIIWDVDQDAVPPQHCEVLTRAVTEYGISLIALFDSIKESGIRDLLGLEWSHRYYHSDEAPLRITGDHFITREFKGQEFSPPRGTDRRHKALVTSAGADVLAAQGDGMAITVRQISNSTTAIWIGGETNTAWNYYPVLVRILRRAVVHAVGYAVYKKFPKSVYFRMDDPSCTAIYENWHFPALNEKEVEEWIVKPLMERKAILSVNMVPGRVMASKRMIEPSWMGVYTDEVGDRHDLVSNARGWKRGIEAGVIEVQSHGWTHMNAHLDPYWIADLSCKLNASWGSEFYDRMRGKEVPGTVQLIHIRKALEGIRRQWNLRPLYFRPGQGAYSVTFANHTARWARMADFGMMRTFWLGKEYIINLQPYLFQPRGGDEGFALPDERPREIGCHDFDVYKDHDFIRKVLDRHGPGYSYVGQNEMIGYFWADVRGGPGSRIVFDYDPHFCRYFQDNDSSWLLHLSDGLLESLKALAGAKIAVDGKAGKVKAEDYLQELNEITIPSGTGVHTWEIR